MGLFSFIETFFFISLAITFVLILLLVYHFKQRIITVEQKCDTMFDIINTMVQEIRYLRMNQQRSSVNQFFPTGQLNTLSNHLSTSTQYNKTNVSEEDNDEDEDESSEDSTDVGNSGDDEDEDEDSEEEEKTVEVKRIVLLDPIEVSANPQIRENESIKVVNIDSEVELTDLPIEQDLENEIDNELEELDPIVTEENILVEKIAEVTHLEDTLENTEAEEEKNKAEKEVYNKMSTAALKQLVVQKGLCSDASKTRRPELLKLLESA